MGDRLRRYLIRTFLAAFVGGLGTLAAHYSWNSLTAPKEVLGYGKVRAASAQGGAAMTARTRRVRQGTVEGEEVELPGGTWISCGGDCARALQREHLDFWRKREENKR